MAKHKYRGGRPAGGKNNLSKGKLWETEEEKQALWDKAHKKVGKSGIQQDYNPGKYKQWVVNASYNDMWDLSSEELDKLIYDYKGNYSLYLRGTKEDDFDGDYQSHKLK